MRAGSLVAAAVVILSGCAGRQDVVIAKGPAAQPQIGLPDYESAVAAFRVDLRGRARANLQKDIERITGVAVAVPFGATRATVSFDGRRHRVRVLAVEPFGFRSVAPASTREAAFVWTALIGGRGVLTPEAARSLGFGTGGNLDLKRGPIDIGAFADNGVPNLGDVMVSDAVASAMGLPPSDGYIVGARPGTDLDRLHRILRNRVDGRVRWIDGPQPRPPEPVETPDPVGTAEGDLIGSMSFRILKNGYIDPDPAWVATNIAQGTVPILGSVTCHRVMFPQLGSALAEIESEGLARSIDRKQFAGCYVPRFIDRDPRRALSMHAFGLALDLNVSTNQLGTIGRMNPEVVAIFEKWGFEWGGRWQRPDPMHFELDRLITP